MTLRTYSIKLFCQSYGLSRSTLYRLWEHRQGPAYMMVGRRRLIPVDAAEAWLGKQMGAAGTPMAEHAKQMTQGHTSHTPSLL